MDRMVSSGGTKYVVTFVYLSGKTIKFCRFAPIISMGYPSNNERTCHQPNEQPGFSNKTDCLEALYSTK